jgi:integrase/recombinase XerD
MDLHKAIEGFLISRTADGYSPATLEMYRWALALLVRRLGNPELGIIQPADIQSFYAWLRSDYVPTRASKSTEPLSSRSVENVWISLRSFFGWAAKELKIDRPDLVVSRPKYGPSVVEPLSVEEIKAMLQACERTKEAKTEKRAAWSQVRPTAARDAALILVLLDTGVRISECARLRVKDVDLTTGEVTVSAFGTGRKTKGRHVYLGKLAKKAVWRYLASREDPAPGDYLFLTDDGHCMNRTSLRLLLNGIGKRAGVDHPHPHRFRHTFAVEYLRNGGDPFTLQRLLGHSTLEMVNHYLQLVNADLAQRHRQASPADRMGL